MAGAADVSTITSVPGQYGLAVPASPMYSGSWTQLPVFHNAVPPDVLHTRGSSPETGPVRCVWPNTT